MAFKFNPLTGFLDLTDGSGGGGPTSADQVSYDNTTSGLPAINVQEAIDELAAASGAVNYSDAFNATSDWTLASPVYKIDIPEGTHLKGINPQVQVYELTGGNYVLINTDVVVDNSGVVSIQVNSSPDLRFQGKVVIS